MKILKILILLGIAELAMATPYKYELRKSDSHVIHIITLSPKDYETKFIKAHNQVFGRETVRRMAEREDADIAINGGFFEIGSEQDGMPSGVMMVDSRIFSSEPGAQDNLILSGGELSIESCVFNMSASLGDEKIRINKYNKFPKKNDVVLYTDTFGKATLTNYKNRREAAFDKDYKLIALYDHGNINIPLGGFVLSFPKSQNLSVDELKLIKIEPMLRGDKITSVVTGIPMLLSVGVVNPQISKQESAFYQKPHTRTALGLKKDGEIVLVVAEHFYKKDLNEVTAGEFRSAIQENKEAIIAEYKKKPNDLTLDELKEIIKSIYTNTSSDAAVGLTIPELANLMIDLGCDSAINLDGGGSSTLWIEGKIIGQTIGDKDEGLGKVIERPVSDAIIFKKR